MLVGLAAALVVADRFREVCPWAERALRTARQAGARSEEAHALSTLGTALAALGETERGLASVREALAIAKQVGNPDDLGRAYGLVAAALMMAGRFTETVTVAENAVESCRQHGTDELYGLELHGLLLGALFWSGRWDEVRQRLSEGQFDQQRPSAAKVALQLVSADFHTGTGDLDEAKRCLDHGRQALASGGHINAVAHVNLRLAELHIWCGEPRAAGEWAAKTWDLLADSDHGPLIAWLLAVASRAEADLALVPGFPHTNPAPVSELADLVAGLPGRLTLGPLAQALHAVAAGEQARAGRGDAVEAWALAASRWARLGCPYPLGYARFRQAEALLATPNRRRPAARALAQAYEIAVRLGAAPLRAEIERLARRARLDLPETVPASAEPVKTAGERGTPERLAQVALTRREEQVLALLTQGHTNREIARALFISQKTVNIHVSHILAKLGVPNRAAAATAAHHLGLIVDLAVNPQAIPDRDEN